RRGDLLISNDSGPVHLAAALNKPVVSIFTRTEPGINPQRWKPYNSQSRWVAVQPQKLAEYIREHRISFTKAGTTDPQYLKLVSVEEVLEAVDACCKLC
ncbi:MAG: hypothetical protein KC713_09285, partial [Candidatus Omnitrophica bacterium]|nr:hypothetical protein [Candidatus Omnitrophota bacterium]